MDIVKRITAGNYNQNRACWAEFSQDLKELLQKSGLDTEKVKKEDMVKSMLAAEAKKSGWVRRVYLLACLHFSLAALDSTWTACETISAC